LIVDHGLSWVAYIEKFPIPWDLSGKIHEKYATKNTVLKISAGVSLSLDMAKLR
jgi:hypothetical protein